MKCEIPYCENDLPDGNPEDYKCAGCGKYVCDQHVGDPWGSHSPEDHDIE